MKLWFVSLLPYNFNTFHHSTALEPNHANVDSADWTFIKFDSSPSPEDGSTSSASKSLPTRKTIDHPKSLGRKIVHIEVGKNLEDFGVHKVLICRISPYFKAAFTSGFEETNSGIMEVPEKYVAVFELFYEWLYTQEVPEDPEEGARHVHSN